jgi:hypothetical protein
MIEGVPFSIYLGYVFLKKRYGAEFSSSQWLAHRTAYKIMRWCLFLYMYGRKKVSYDGTLITRRNSYSRLHVSKWESQHDETTIYIHEHIIEPLHKTRDLYSVLWFNYVHVVG